VPPVAMPERTETQKASQISRLKVPSTDANGRATSEMAVVPGSILYQRWLELLTNGEISYQEFLDWTTPEDRRTRVTRLIDVVRDILGGFRGVPWRKGM